MKKYIKFLIPLVIAPILIAFVVNVFGIYWEEYEGVDAGIINGDFAEPIKEVLVQDITFLITHIVSYVSTLFPTVTVLAFCHIFVLFLIIAVWASCFQSLIERIKGLNSFEKVCLLLLFVWSWLGTSLVSANTTRDSILLTSGSLILYFLNFEHKGRKAPLLFFCLFALGFILRIHTGILAIVNILLFFVVVNKQLLTPILKFKYCFIFAAACFAILEIYQISSANPVAKIDLNYEIAINNKLNVAPLSEMHNAKDSIRYIALLDYFLISDTANISIPFIERIFKHQTVINFEMNDSNIRNLYSKLFNVISNQWSLIALSYLAIFILSWANRFKGFGQLLLYNVLSWLIVILLALKVNILERFVVPWFSITIILSLLCVLKSEMSLSWSKKILFFLCMIILTYYVTLDMRAIATNESEGTKQAAVYLKNIQSVTNNKYAVMWNDTQYPSDIFFDRKQTAVLQRCLHLSLVMPMFYDFGRERSIKTLGFNPLDWKQMYTQFMVHKDSIVFIIDDNFASFLTDYYWKVYGLKLKLTKVQPPIEIYSENYVYKIE